MSTISELEFRAEAIEFLDGHASRRGEAKEFVWGEGSDNVSILEEKTAEQEAAEMRAAKEWKATEFDAGFGWITGPEEYGGRALPTAYERAYREIASRYALGELQIHGWYYEIHTGRVDAYNSSTGEFELWPDPV